MKKTTLLFVFLTAVCVNAEWTFDNDKDVQEKGDKRDAEREEARKALERVRFGVKVGGFLGKEIIGENLFAIGGEVGIMMNTPLSRIKDANLVLATELNYGSRFVEGSGYDEYKESYLSIPLSLQYVSFFFPTSDIQVHWVPSPKRYVFMHLKTIAEAGAFIDIPLGTKLMGESGWYIDENGNKIDFNYGGNYKDRNFFDLGVMVGYAAQLENIILGLRVAASYVDFGGSTLMLQGKLYLGYLF